MNEIAKSQFEVHKMYAMWWMNYANTEHNKNRTVTNLGSGIKMTPDELVQDAMETSKRHIELCQKIAGI